LPAEVQGVAGFKSQNPRSPTGNGTGFDAFVGRFGTGTLEITAVPVRRSRMQYLWATILAQLATCSSMASTLFWATGGSFDFGPTTQTESHMTIIGRLGTGNLTITMVATMERKFLPAVAAIWALLAFRWAVLRTLY